MVLAAALSVPTGDDAFGVGILLALGGAFLLANSILFRHPRSLVSEYFGGERERLTSIRGYIFHRLQIHLGFLLLILGFGLQLYGFYAVEPGVARPTPAFPLRWVGGLFLAVCLLEIGGWWLSLVLCRRYLREYFLAHPPPLETDPVLARELGDLFGVATSDDDSVQSYLLRIRRRIGLPSVGEARPGFAAAAETRPAEESFV